MKDKENKMLTKEIIINSALEEFGTSSYAETSINTICKRGGISKGIVYHYFKDKDDLYLSCVQICFDELVGELKSVDLDFKDFEKDIAEYIKIRNLFFEKNKNLGYIFISSVVQPPKHLIDEIKEVKKDFDQVNIDFYNKVLSNVNLRENLSKADAIDYFIMLQEGFNSYFNNLNFDTYEDMLKAHGKRIEKFLSMSIYGIIRED